MCQRRRVYWACLHEDINVTPPSPLLYCAKATPRANGASDRDSDGNSIRHNDLKPCASVDSLPLTAKHDLFNAVMRPENCEACAADSTTGLSDQEAETDNHDLSTAYQDANSIKDVYRDTEEATDEDIDGLEWIMSNYSLQESERESTEVRERQSSGSTDGAWFPDAGPMPEGDFQLYDDDDDDRFVEDDMEDIGSKGSNEKTPF
ncbi:hypothetical protein F5Y11DRAFT_316880 [Daldinia sp. FL1419]|nr:hypothetical protein F5Y11DRAFT_316880 [Daldinia sp. FL1419]